MNNENRGERQDQWLWMAVAWPREQAPAPTTGAHFGQHPPGTNPEVFAPGVFRGAGE